MIYIKREYLNLLKNVKNIGVITEYTNTESDDLFILKDILKILNNKNVSHIILICNETPSIKSFIEEDNGSFISVYFKNTNHGDIYMKEATCAADILQAIISGFKQILITSPILNCSAILKNLHEKFDITYAIKVNDNHGEGISARWIRPEGIRLYEDFCNIFIIDSNPEFINYVVRAYQEQSDNLFIGDVIANLRAPVGQVLDALVPSNFDEKRANCGANCWKCNDCYRTLGIYYNLQHDIKKERNNKDETEE